MPLLATSKDDWSVRSTIANPLTVSEATNPPRAQLPGAGSEIHIPPGNDELNGGDKQDDLHGGPGNDELNGGGGKDDLFGEAGDDALNGGANMDDCDGGPHIVTDTAVACEAVVGVP